MSVQQLKALKKNIEPNLENAFAKQTKFSAAVRSFILSQTIHHSIATRFGLFFQFNLCTDSIQMQKVGGISQETFLI